MRALEKQLPLAVFVLLALLATSVTLVAYREVRATTRTLFGERLTRVTAQVASTTGMRIRRLQDSVAEAARDPALIGALVDPDRADMESAAAVIASAAPATEGGLLAAAWDLSGEIVVVGRAVDTTGWVTPPPLLEVAATTPLVAENDTLIHYGVVAPVRDGPRLVGFLQVRQRLGGGNGGEAMRALVGDSARLLLGSSGGGVWTDLSSVVTRPPTELIGAGRLVTYERDGTRRLGVGQILPGTNLSIVAEVDESAALAGMRAFLLHVGVVAAILVLLVTAAAWMLGRRITGPLSNLRSAAEALGGGDYARRASEEGHPEIAEVARAFNKMAAETEGYVTEIRASEERFRSLVTATAQIVLWTDPDGNIAEPLPSWQAYTGLSFEESRGAGWTAALHPDDALQAIEAWQEAVQRRSLYEAEYRIRRHDGEYRWFVVRFVPVLSRDKQIREWVGTGTDITDRREAEQRLKAKELELQRSQRLDAIGQLVGGIAHDFNNLLTAIMGPSELAELDLPEDHPVRQDLRDIRDAAMRAGELTRKLMVFGRQQVVDPVALDANEEIVAAGRLLKRLIGESIRLEIAPTATEPGIVADRTQIEQIIVNLAVNARDAMPDGGRLTIETSNVEVDQDLADQHQDLRPGSYVLVSVTDTGVGMDEETLSRMFDPFFTTKGEDDGTGLGLSTVYGIVRQAGGHVSVYSEPGQGTTLKVYLPRADSAVEEGIAPAEAGPTPRGTETILLAEDEDTIRRIAARILTQLGYTVLATQDGEEALEIARSQNGIDLLVSDVVMPAMNGLELWERLRAERPALPALFLSGWASDAVVRHGILDGRVPFLQKPFSGQELGAKVREVLDN